MDVLLEKLNLLEGKIARLVSLLAEERKRSAPLVEENEILKQQISREKQKASSLEEKLNESRRGEAEQKKTGEGLKKRLEKILKELDEVPDRLVAESEED